MTKRQIRRALGRLYGRNRYKSITRMRDLKGNDWSIAVMRWGDVHFSSGEGFY